MNGFVDRMGARNWVAPALLGSLILNLFLIGLLVGPMLFDHSPRREGRGFGAPSPFMGMLGRDSKSLPKDDRDAIRAIMVEQFPNIRPYFPKIGEARLALADALASDPYDAEKVRAAFANLDNTVRGMTKAMNESLVTGFAKLPADQRARIAQAMREKIMRRNERREKRENEASPAPAQE